MAKLNRATLVFVATLFVCVICSLEARADNEDQLETKNVIRQFEKAGYKVTKDNVSKHPTDNNLITTIVQAQRGKTEEEEIEEPPTTKKRSAPKDTITPAKPTQKDQSPTGKKRSDIKRTAPVDHSTMPRGQVIVKGHVQTKDGKPLANAIVTWEDPKPTPRDFLTAADPGWDRKKDAQSPPFDASRDDGSFAVTFQGVPRVVPVRDVPAKDMIVRLDTSNQYIARLKPGTEPTKFVKDHELEESARIISIDPDIGGGWFVSYPVPTDEKKARDLQDAISKDKRVAFAEPDDCREIQPNGRSETYPLADATMRVGKDCETTPILIGGPGEPQKWAVVVGVEDNPTLPVTGFANEGFHDANEFAQLLLRNGFAPEDLNPPEPMIPKPGTHMVTLLAGTGVGKELLPLLDEPLLKPRGPGVAATNKRIEDALTWLAQVAKADDMVVFYFSGHGNADKTGAWFYSSDDKFTAQDLAQKIQNIDAQKKLIILDFSKAEAFLSALEGPNRVILFGAEKDESLAQKIGRSVHKANGEQFHRHHPLTWNLLQLWGKAPQPLRVPLQLERFPTYFKLPENTDGLTLCGQLIPKKK